MTASPPRLPVPSVLKVSGAEEVLAFVPHALGFEPEESVVFVSLRPPRSRIGLTARCDLEAVASAHGSEVAAAMAEHLLRDGADQVICVVYTHGTVAAARERAQVTRAVGAIEAARGMPRVREIWLVTPTGYGAFDCHDPGCCPPRGRALADLAGTRVAAELAVRGSAPSRQRADLAPPRSSSRSGRRAFAEAYARTKHALASGEGGGGEAALAEIAAALTSPPPRPSELGRLAALLSDSLRRDEVLLWVATAGSEQAVPTRLRDPGPAGAAEVPALFRQGAPRPVPERIESALAVLMAAVALAKGGARADLCASLAWLRWWQGDGAAAELAAAEARSIRADHRLAGLVEEILRRAVPPGWCLPDPAA